MVGKAQFEATCANGCHGVKGEGIGDVRGVDPRDYTQAELETYTLTHMPAGNFGPCTTVDNCALNTSAYIKSLAAEVDEGATLYADANWGCLDCHGEDGAKTPTIFKNPAASKKKPLDTLTTAIDLTMPYRDPALQLACDAACSAKIALFWKMLQWDATPR